MMPPSNGRMRDPVVDVAWLRERMASAHAPRERDHRAPAPLRIFDTRFDLHGPEAGHALYLAGHIPGAAHLDLDRDLSSPPGETGGRHPLPDPETFAALLREFGVSDETELVFYDQGGSMFAARAWWVAEWLGHPRAHVLDGGIAAWVEEGGALATGDADEAAARSGPPGDFRARPDMARVLDAEAVERLSAELLASAAGDADDAAGGGRLAGSRAGAADDPAAHPRPRRRVLLDARDARRYAGRRSPLDAVGGHIPGAASRPWMENYRPDGRWRSPESLAELYSDIARADEAVVYCGSGVSACVDIIGMRRAGLAEPRLYVGSWSDWTSRPGRPVARGEPSPH